MNEDEEILESLIAGGLIGAALGALLSQKEESNGAFVGSMLGAAILATYKANQQAKKANIPVYEVENGNLIEIGPNGVKRIIKKIEQSNIILPKNFQLK
jgi:hypothetical protein